MPKKNCLYFKKLRYAILFVIITSIFVYPIYYGYQYTRVPLTLSKKNKIIILLPGKSAKHFVMQLDQEKLLSHPKFLYFLLRLNGEANKLQAGEYKIKKGMTAADLLDDIIAGKVVQHSIRFIEGWTFAQMKQLLAIDPYLLHTVDTLSNKAIMQQLGVIKKSPEGLFFPDTYYFKRDATDLSILKTAYAHMQQELNKVWSGRSKNIRYRSPYQVLIVASLIEKETGLPAERSKISGVIHRRLTKYIPLQIDPTVLYGLGQLYDWINPYDRSLTKHELKRNTPYNTYQHYGLPPTPIAMPGRGALYAATHPEQGTALYYVAKGDGSHYFSETYKQHRQAIKKYLLNKH